MTKRLHLALATVVATYYPYTCEAGPPKSRAGPQVRARASSAACLSPSSSSSLESCEHEGADQPGVWTKANVSELGGRKRPHVLLVVLDDVGWNDLAGYNGGVSGDQYARTPALGASIAEGIKLQRLYTQSQCSPTRACLMTGRFPHRYGAQHFVQKPHMPTFLPEDETTLADKMLASGYSTAMVGKWHLGYGLRKFTPTARGFQRFFGSYEVGGDHFAHTVGPGTHALGAQFLISDGVQQTLDMHRETSVTGQRRDTHEFVTNQRGIYSAQMLAREAVAEISAAAATEQLLFMYVAFTTIHTPLQVPPEFVAANSHMQGSQEARINAGMMTATDSGFGEIVGALKAHGMWDNTVLLCLSDNGAQIMQGASNFPLRGNKMSPWEGGIRSVGFLSGGHPDIRAAVGSTYTGLLHAVDMHSMLLHAAGADADFARVQPKALDAKDGPALWHSVIDATGAAPAVRTEFIANLDPLGQVPWMNARMGWSLGSKVSAVRSGRWKLIVGFPGRDDWYPGDPGKCFKKLAHEGGFPEPPLDHPECIRGDLKYEKVNAGMQPKGTWLFDLEADPNERHDLSAAESDVVQELRAKIDRAHAESVPPFPDRWASLAGLMHGIFHEMNPGGGYDAALTNWQEPEHLAKVDFFRRARQWLRVKLVGSALGVLEGVTYAKSKAPKPLLRPEAASADVELHHDVVRALDRAVRLSSGLSPEVLFSVEELEGLEEQLLELEAAHASPSVGPGWRSIAQPRSRL